MIIYRRFSGDILQYPKGKGPRNPWFRFFPKKCLKHKTPSLSRGSVSHFPTSKVSHALLIYNTGLCPKNQMPNAPYLFVMSNDRHLYAVPDTKQHRGPNLVEFVGRYVGWKELVRSMYVRTFAWNIQHPHDVLIPETLEVGMGFPVIKWQREPATIEAKKFVMSMMTDPGLLYTCFRCGLPSEITPICGGEVLSLCPICLDNKPDVHPTWPAENKPNEDFKKGDYRTWSPERDQLDDKIDGEEPDLPC